MPAPILILVVLGAIVAISLAIATQRATIERWTVAATQLGLDVVPGGFLSSPRISGLLSGFPVSVHTFNTGGGKNQQRYTRFEVTYPSLDLGLVLNRQTAVGGFFRRVFNREDTEVGDAGFDAAFVVKSQEPARLAAFLTAQRRSTLERFLAAFPTMQVTDTSVRVDVRRVVRDPDVLVSTIRRLVGVAQSLVDGRGDAATAREAGELSDALGRMRTAVESNPDDVERRLDEMDALAAAGRTGDFDTRIAELEQLAPTDPDVVAWKRTLSRREAASTRDEEAATGELRPVDAHEATQDLLGGRQLSFAVRDKFVAEYQGRPVSWSGIVKSARAYETDGDFGKGPGVKVVATVASLEHELFGATDVDAVVEFSGVGPVPERGDTITFTGTLTAVDPLMRNFTVRRATRR